MITDEGLKKVLAMGEGTEVEYKKSQTDLARKIYESICAFLNRKGGHVVLGADDDGSVVGIEPGKVQTQLDTLAKDMNNPQLFRPTYYLEFEEKELDGKKLIYGYVPESGQAHSYKGVYYDRNQDGDFELRSTEQIANLFIRKSKRHTEDRVYPVFGMQDLDEEAFVYMRKMVMMSNPTHEWLEMSDEEVLRSGQMIITDPETGREGMTLAAILLFGKRDTIASVLPQYNTDVLMRVHDTELYDDRVQVKDNLMVAYRRMMEFVQKHLPEKPYIEGLQRFSLRDKILREVCLNMLIHREYASAYPATLTIWKDRIETENWNVPFVYGRIDLKTLKPHRKNPAIANVFSQMGIVEELGSGTKKMFKYTPLFSGGKEPVIDEQDVYRITIPYEGVTDKNQQETDKNRQVTDNERLVLELLRDGEHSLLEMMAVCGYRDRDSFRKSVLNQMLEKEWVNMTHPENLRHRGQKYFLSEKDGRWRE